MKAIFKPGDQKTYQHQVIIADFASFMGELVHPVYATFALARDAEWSSRQFALECCEPDEEGVGIFLSIDHRAPALEDDLVTFTAWIDQIHDNEIFCFVEVKVGDRLIAICRTGQKIIKKEKLNKIFQGLRQ